MAEFLTDVQTLRARARAHIEQGPITSAYGADRDRVRRPRAAAPSHLVQRDG